MGSQLFVSGFHDVNTDDKKSGQHPEPIHIDDPAGGRRIAGQQHFCIVWRGEGAFIVKEQGACDQDSYDAVIFDAERPAEKTVS